MPLPKRKCLVGLEGWLAFEVKGNADDFMKKLKLIKRAISLGGVESTVTSPVKTSHAKMSATERTTIGVTDNLVRFSVGIEEAADLIADIEQGALVLRPIDQYFLQKEEPVKGCLLALRDSMLRFHTEITEEWKYGMPMYYFRGKMFCYLWVHKKYQQPYIGIVEEKGLNTLN